MKNKSLLIIFFLLVLSCDNNDIHKPNYNNQIGDTPFNALLDNPEFQFCDSTNVLHKRALVSYSGGKKTLNEDLKEMLRHNQNSELFNGYIIIRFAVNCKNETGRFRFEILDDKFNLTQCSDELKQHISTAFISLNKWKHAVYSNKDFDCYTFRTLKLTNGKIELL